MTVILFLSIFILLAFTIAYWQNANLREAVEEPKYNIISIAAQNPDHNEIAEERSNT